VCGACVEEPGRPPGTDAFAPASGMRANGGGGVRGVSVGRARSDRRRLDRARSGIERTFAGNDAARETAGSSGRAKTRAAARRPRHTRETRTFGLARAEHRALCSSQGASRVVDWRHAPRQFGSSEKTRFWRVLWRAACRGFGGRAARGFHIGIRDGEKGGGENGARARGTARTRRAALGRRRSSRRCPHGRARLLFVPQARKREGGTYRYKTKTVAFISIATPCRAPRVVALVALAAKKNPLHPSRV